MRQPIETAASPACRRQTVPAKALLFMTSILSASLGACSTEIATAQVVGSAPRHCKQTFTTWCVMAEGVHFEELPSDISGYRSKWVFSSNWLGADLYMYEAPGCRDAGLTRKARLVSFDRDTASQPFLDSVVIELRADRRCSLRFVAPAETSGDNALVRSAISLVRFCGDLSCTVNVGADEIITELSQLNLAER